MRRTAQRFSATAPHETLLVMDATTGQNGLQQARLFTQSAGVTGIVSPSSMDGQGRRRGRHLQGTWPARALCRGSEKAATCCRSIRKTS